MRRRLLYDEYVVVDDGYVHEKCVNFKHVASHSAEFHKKIRAHHEAVNERLKISM